MINVDWSTGLSPITLTMDLCAHYIATNRYAMNIIQ